MRKSGKKLKVHDAKYQDEAVSQLNDAQKLAAGYEKPDFTFPSCVEQDAKVATIDLMTKVADFHAEKGPKV